jgi:hypothetical protein
MAHDGVIVTQVQFANMRLEVNKMFILLIKDDFLEAIEILEDSNIKWCALATMFGTQDITKKSNMYIKFYDMEM